MESLCQYGVNISTNQHKMTAAGMMKNLSSKGYPSFPSTISAF